jgi:uncharacterized protein YqfA (UPF0365 family)
MEIDFLVFVAIDVATLIGLWLIFYIIPVGLWFNALVNGLPISLLRIVLMRWRRIPPDLIINAMITAHKGDLKIELDDLEVHYLAGGDVGNVISAMIMAKKAGLNLSFKKASIAELEGCDLLELVKERTQL